jgi:hypothetical protein
VTPLFCLGRLLGYSLNRLSQNFQPPRLLAIHIEPKFEYYRSLPTFQEYLLIDQERIYVEHYHRLHIGRWEYTILVALEETVKLQSITLEIPVHQLYEQVDWLNQQ